MRVRRERIGRREGRRGGEGGEGRTEFGGHVALAVDPGVHEGAGEEALGGAQSSLLFGVRELGCRRGRGEGCGVGLGCGTRCGW